MVFFTMKIPRPPILRCSAPREISGSSCFSGSKGTPRSIKVMTAVLCQNDAISIINDGNFSPYILSVGFAGVNGETLMRELQDKGVIVGMGSACSAKKSGNRILENMGKGKDEIKSHICISFNEFLSEKEVETAGRIILQTYQQLWERVK